MIKKITSILTIGSVSLLVAGCGMFDPVATPIIKKYQLDQTDADKIVSCSPKKGAPIMQISMFKVDEPFDTYTMYYSDNTYQLTSYSQNEWVARPAKMLTQATQEKLLGTCLYANVVSSDFMTSSTYRLAGQVLDFKQVINNSTAIMQLSVIIQLIDNKTNSVLASKIFVEKVNTTPDVVGYINGANQATQSYLNDMATWLQTVQQ